MPLRVLRGFRKRDDTERRTRGFQVGSYLNRTYALTHVAQAARPPHPSPGGFATTSSPLLTESQERGGGRGVG